MTAGTPERPLRRDAERNRQRILAAAREVFAARGLDVTLDDIAAHAGLGVGTVYRRFPSREHLVEALFDTRIDQIVAWAQEALRHPDAWTGLTEFLDRSTGRMADDRGLRDVMFSDAYGRAQVAKIKAQIAPAIDALVQRCQQAGVIRSDVIGGDVVLVQFMLVALVEYTERVQPDLWRRYLAIMLDGLRGAQAPLPVAAPDMDNLALISQQWKPPRRPAPE